MRIVKNVGWGILIFAIRTATIGLCSRLTEAETSSSSKRNRQDIMKASNAATFGGGEINEKLRTFHTTTNDSDEEKDSRADYSNGFQPHIHKTHLWHALEGFDRYPNYFDRWRNIIPSRKESEDPTLSRNKLSDDDEKDMDDLLKLEQALRDTADAVRRERERIAQQRTTWRQKIPQFLQENPQFRKFWDVSLFGEDWEKWCSGILHPKVQELFFISNIATGTTHLKACPEATVTQVLSGIVPVEWNVSLLTELLDEECTDVYSMPILSGAFCHELIQLIVPFGNFSRKTLQSNNLVSSPCHSWVSLGWTIFSFVYFCIPSRSTCLTIYISIGIIALSQATPRDPIVSLPVNSWYPTRMIPK